MLELVVGGPGRVRPLRREGGLGPVRLLARADQLQREVQVAWVEVRPRVGLDGQGRRDAVLRPVGVVLIDGLFELCVRLVLESLEARRSNVSVTRSIVAQLCYRLVAPSRETYLAVQLYLSLWGMPSLSSTSSQIRSSSTMLDDPAVLPSATTPKSRSGKKKTSAP